MQRRKTRRVLLAAGLLTLAVSAGLFSQGGSRPPETPAPDAFIPAITTVEAAEVSPWELGARKVKEDRGEPVGKQAKTDVPPQLRHYSDSRRFLALQVAEWRKHGLETPLDYADLAGLIREGQLVELKPVGDSYIFAFR